MKIIIYVCIFFLSINTIFAQEAVKLDLALSETVDYLNERLPAGSRIVVLNFKSDYPSLTDHIIDEIISQIVNSRVLVAIDRQNLDIIRQEMNFQLSGDVSDESAQAIGKLLGAETIVSGEIIPFGRIYRLRVRAISVETAVVQGSFSRNILLDKTIKRFTEENVSIDLTRFGISVGGGLILGGSFQNYSMNISGINYPSTGYSDFNVGLFAFIDLKYAEFIIAYSHGSGKGNDLHFSYYLSTGELIEYPTVGPTYEYLENYFNIGILGKYPFNINQFLLYPLLGLQYQLLLSLEVDGVKVTDDLSRNNSLWVKMGFGMDYYILRNVFIHGKVLWGIKFNSENESNYDTLPNNFTIRRFTHQPSLNVGIGYRF